MSFFLFLKWIHGILSFHLQLFPHWNSQALWQPSHGLQYRMFRTMKDDGSHRGPRDPHTHSNTDARVSFLPLPLWDPKMFCVMCNGFSFVFHVSWQNYLGAWHRQSDMQCVDALDKHQLPLTWKTVESRSKWPSGLSLSHSVPFLTSCQNEN